MRSGVLLASFVATSLLLGCQKSTKSQDAPATSGTGRAAPSVDAAARTATAPAPPAPPPPDPSKPGPAYLLDESDQLTVIDAEGNASAVQGLEKAKTLTRGQDGHVYAIGPGDDSIFRLDGAVATALVPPPLKGTSELIRHLSVGAKGVLYFQRLSGLVEATTPGDSASWKRLASPPPEPQDAIVHRTTVDSSGRLWVVTLGKVDGSYENRVFRLEGDAFRRIDAPAEVEGLTSTGKETFVLTKRAVLSVADAEAATAPRFAGAEHESLEGIADAADGTVAVSGSLRGFYVLAPGAKKPTLVPADTLFHHHSVDSGGRVWAFMGNEIHFGRGKGVERAAAQGTLPRIDSDIRSAVIAGTGPASLKTVATRTGILHGVVTKAGAPVANAEVEICMRPSTFISKSPCEDASVRRRTKTDAAGAFRIADAPVGRQNVAAKLDNGKWFVSSSYGPGRVVHQGEDLDVGTLDFARAP